MMEDKYRENVKKWDKTSLYWHHVESLVTSHTDSILFLKNEMILKQQYIKTETKLYWIKKTIVNTLLSLFHCSLLNEKPSQIPLPEKKLLSEKGKPWT